MFDRLSPGGSPLLVLRQRCAFALLCSASIEDKVDFAHSLFDFRSEGDLNLDEVTILLRTTLLASAKVSPIPQRSGKLSGLHSKKWRLLKLVSARLILTRS